MCFLKGKKKKKLDHKIKIVAPMYIPLPFLPVSISAVADLSQPISSSHITTQVSNSKHSRDEMKR